MHLNLTKTDIINRIAWLQNYKLYLELCTATTGNCYQYVNKESIDCSRIMYRCPADFDDNMKIDYRCVDDDIEPALAELSKTRGIIDICLVDGWHTYENAIRDLRAAYALVSDSGVIVVHDCLPPSADLVTPHYKAGEWCGVSYKAYLDFVLTQKNIGYFTVDTDYGCGVIFKNKRISLAEDIHAGNIFQRIAWKIRRKILSIKYFRIGNNFDHAYLFMMANKNELLNLISAEDFLASFNSA